MLEITNDHTALTLFKHYLESTLNVHIRHQFKHSYPTSITNDNLRIKSSFRESSFSAFLAL